MERLFYLKGFSHDFPVATKVVAPASPKGQSYGAIGINNPRTSEQSYGLTRNHNYFMKRFSYMYVLCILVCIYIYRDG